MFCGILEVMGIAYIYGILMNLRLKMPSFGNLSSSYDSVTLSMQPGYNRFSSDVKLMLGHPLNWYWKFTWVITAPLFTLVSLKFSSLLVLCINYSNICFVPHSYIVIGHCDIQLDSVQSVDIQRNPFAALGQRNWLVVVCRHISAHTSWRPSRII